MLPKNKPLFKKGELCYVITNNQQNVLQIEDIIFDKKEGFKKTSRFSLFRMV